MTSKNKLDIMEGDSSSIASTSSHGNASLSGTSVQTPSLSSDGDLEQKAVSTLGISNHEQRVVNCSRWAFLLCLLISAAALAAVVFVVAANEEQDDFDAQCETMAHDIIDISNNNINRVMNVLQGLSVLTTSFLIAEQSASDGRQGKGFVTIPDVEQHFGTARQTSGALILAYLPEVAPSEMDAWSQYSADNQGWIQESHPGTNVTESILPNIWGEPPEDGSRALDEEGSTCDTIGHRMLMSAEEKAQRVPLEPDAGPFSPVWTFSPPPRADDVGIVNFDLRAKSVLRKAVDFISVTHRPTFLDVCNQAAWFDHQEFVDILQTVIAFPVFDGFDTSTSNVVGHLIAIIPWEVFFSDILLEENPISMTAVLENTCNEIFSFNIKGHEAKFLAEKDVHDRAFDNMVIRDSFATLEDFEVRSMESGTSRREQEIDEKTCHYTISVYPTKQMEEEFVTNSPFWYAGVVLGVFGLTSLLFVVFDCFVRRRTQHVMRVALKHNAIVSSLFPKSVQDKMMAEADENEKLGKMGKAGIKSYLNANKETEKTIKSDVLGGRGKPIADLFPATTIMFADIAGFTAWSSAREPSQVFILLESIYAEFDRIAQRRRVFKVEVVGDCYVAVCGLPDPRKDHAIVMAKFAKDCLREMDRLTEKLVRELGPDTNDLSLRVGLHSGAVVAGVLRGDKSRFQLFGDTVNTASRMESTGVSGKIQISQETADLLLADGKESWLIKRDDAVTAKGKGELVTYFLEVDAHNKDQATRRSSTGKSIEMVDSVAENFDRITEWTSQVMADLLRDVAMRRKMTGATEMSMQKWVKELAPLERKIAAQSQEGQKAVIDEVQEIIELPDHKTKCFKNSPKCQQVELDSETIDELRDYVRSIAQMYNDNPFHNFEHAMHVTMSVVKLLSRIVAPDIDEIIGTNKSLDDHTYGITADPLTRFAVVLSALIHDVDHSGVSNAQLAKEGSRLATHYKNKSVAEQNSVDLAWDLLMEPNYANLRRAIYSTSDEFHRFRSLLVNTVMATDIMDKDLKKLRNDRWDTAFDSTQNQVSREAVNRKATIVLEHLIQASDVAHTMQHWHIYRKWNERLFREMYRAHQMGRLETDPSENWYKGEMGFFDFYIIPLAKKLKECGVFGVSSDEYLAYAQQNRKEWERKGETVVRNMVQAIKDGE